MRKLIGLIFLLFCSVYANGQIKKLESEHFDVKFEAETEKYVHASTKVLDFAYDFAVKNGYNLPDRIKFKVIQSDRTALWFDRKHKNKITWEYTSLSDFLPPVDSKKKNIYGLCHEIGHLCMYRTFSKKTDWMSYDYRESWADFFGNYVIDSLYKELGADFWPEPHDLLKHSGMNYLNNRIKNNNPKLESFNKSSQYWIDLTLNIGFENINDFFLKISAQQISNPNARDKYLDVLTVYCDDKNIKDWFYKYADYLILNE